MFKNENLRLHSIFEDETLSLVIEVDKRLDRKDIMYLIVSSPKINDFLKSTLTKAGFSKIKVDKFWFSHMGNKTKIILRIKEAA
ncbi:MAG: hypothetical protein ACTSYS_14000 [Promethearchaeota archaeon]